LLQERERHPRTFELCILMVAADLTVSVAKELVERKARFNDVKGAICMSAVSANSPPRGRSAAMDLIDILGPPRFGLSARIVSASWIR